MGLTRHAWVMFPLTGAVVVVATAVAIHRAIAFNDRSVQRIVERQSGCPAADVKILERWMGMNERYEVDVCGVAGTVRCLSPDFECHLLDAAGRFWGLRSWDDPRGSSFDGRTPAFSATPEGFVAPPDR